jgi:hypothetical protein
MYYVSVPCCSVQPDNAGNPRGIAKISSGARFCTFADQPNAIETSDLSPCARTCHQCTRSAVGEDACAFVRLGAIVGYVMLPFCISAVTYRVACLASLSSTWPFDDKLSFGHLYSESSVGARCGRTSYPWLRALVIALHVFCICVLLLSAAS